MAGGGGEISKEANGAANHLRGARLRANSFRVITRSRDGGRCFDSRARACYNARSKDREKGGNRRSGKGIGNREGKGSLLREIHISIHKSQIHLLTPKQLIHHILNQQQGKATLPATRNHKGLTIYNDTYMSYQIISITSLEFQHQSKHIHRWQSRELRWFQLRNQLIEIEHQLHLI